MMVMRSVLLFVFVLALPAAVLAETQTASTPDDPRIDPLDGRSVDMTGDDLAADSFDHSWPLSGSRARMAIRGYVKLDYIQDFNGAYDRFQFLVEGIPVSGDDRPEQSGYMNMFARESRFNFDIRTFTRTVLRCRSFWRSISGTWRTRRSSPHRGSGTSMECSAACWRDVPGAR